MTQRDEKAVLAFHVSILPYARLKNVTASVTKAKLILFLSSFSTGWIVEKTVKPLKTVEKVGISEKNKNDVLWLKRPVMAFQQGWKGHLKAQKYDEGDHRGRPFAMRLVIPKTWPPVREGMAQQE